MFIGDKVTEGIAEESAGDLGEHIP